MTHNQILHAYNTLLLLIDAKLIIARYYVGRVHTLRRDIVVGDALCVLVSCIRHRLVKVK